jgi:hypothetical protein
MALVLKEGGKRGEASDWTSTFVDRNDFEAAWALVENSRCTAVASKPDV